jgi:diphosphomevalonate decarboxylase
MQERPMQASAQAQSNIALVKYWGKRDIGRNLPAVSSLSITLGAIWTTMNVTFGEFASDTLSVADAPRPDMLPRVSRCLDLVAGDERRFASVASETNFPIGAGLASSASAFAALVVAANHASGGGRGTQELARLAGTASGSASRSLYGGFVLLTAGESGIDVQQLAGADAWPLNIVIAITEEGSKPIGSGEAMIRSAGTSPFYGSWLERQPGDIRIATDAVASRDFEALAAVSEHNCLKMHSVMWTSRPSIVYWNVATIACMEAVRQLQSEGHGVFFTIDAGPQVKAVCLPESVDKVRSEIAAIPGVSRTIVSGLGEGARVLDE